MNSISRSGLSLLSLVRLFTNFVKTGETTRNASGKARAAATDAGAKAAD